MITTKNIASDNGIFLWLLHDAMKRLGLDTAAIFASVGLPDVPPDSRQRRENWLRARFWQKAEEVSGDPQVGLHVGALMQPFRGQVVEYLFLSSSTFGEGLRRASRYQQLLTDALQMELVVDGSTARLEGMEHPVRHYLECALAVLLTFLRHVSEGVFVPQAIHLKQQEGASQQEYQAVYGCPVQLGSTTNAICFDAGLLGLPSPAAAPTLLAMHEQAAAQELADVAHQRLVWQVERELGGLLEGGELTLEAVANRLARSPRQLRQALSQAGTSFKQVVAEYREQLARRLLVRTREPLEQIVYLTGFSEPSAFTRAFKRWTGETPSAYRLRHQKDT